MQNILNICKLFQKYANFQNLCKNLQKRDVKLFKNIKDFP